MYHRRRRRSTRRVHKGIHRRVKGRARRIRKYGSSRGGIRL